MQWLRTDNICRELRKQEYYSNNNDIKESKMARQGVLVDMLIKESIKPKRVKRNGMKLL